MLRLTTTGSPWYNEVPLLSPTTSLWKTDLFQLEDVSDEELLKVLVGVVNTQLLKAVLFEVLKTEDIENADGGSLVFVGWGRLENGVIDLFYHPDEHTPVNTLDEGIADVHGVFRAECGLHGLPSSKDGTMGEGMREILWRNLENIWWD